MVQTGFYSDVIGCSPLDRRVPGSIFGQSIKIFIGEESFRILEGAKV